MSKRFLALILSLTVLGLPTIADRASAGSPLLFGAYPAPRGGQTQQAAVTQFESTVGRKMIAIRVYNLWNSPFPTAYESWLRDTDHILALSVKALRTNGSRVRWIDIANAQPGSQLYGELIGWADRIRTFGGPVWFIFNHEPEARTNDGSGGAQDFIAAWRRVITVFRERGVENAKYVWTATSYAFERTDERRAALWYPGDAYVDAIAADPYNWYDCREGVNNPWRSLQQILEPMRQFGQAHASKELMLMEFGSYEDPAVSGRKAQWFSGVQQLFKQPGWEQYTAILAYNTVTATHPECRWWIDTSQSSLDAFRALANDPHYAAGLTPDTLPPSTPGRPTGHSPSPGSILISWAASIDPSLPITYHVYRDGSATAVGLTMAPTFTDTGLAPGSLHTYAVTATDAAGNVSATSDPSSEILVSSPSQAIFSDDFSSGSLSGWTSVTRLTIDPTQGSPVAPSARGQVTAQSAYALRALGTLHPSACFSVSVNASLLQGAVDLFRLRTASNGPIVRAFVHASGSLAIRSDSSGTQVNSGVPLGSGWHKVELCGTVGSTSTWDLYRDGARIVTAWAANTGAEPIGLVQIGDTASKTWRINFDTVRLDLSAGG